MTIPLNDLYHYIYGLFPTPVCMYLFYPHGSKNISNIIGLNSILNRENIVLPLVMAHDQEPLNYQMYQDHPDELVDWALDLTVNKVSKQVIKNTNLSLPMFTWNNHYQQVLLIHSEQNSSNLNQYEQDNYIGIYYWAHAFIALDWYRFAKIDKRLQQKKPINCTPFLIYCREWSGSREYRIKFQELLVKHNLLKHSKTSIDKNYTNHTFSNQQLTPESYDFLNQLDHNEVHAAESASYVPDDFVNSHISVVLETVVDGDTIHLTEKILRAVACQHPFILAAAPGSLKYLKNYGFKTFEPWIDESYDNETNTVRRLEKIISAMQKFVALPAREQQQHLIQMKKIARFNKKHFFSKKFRQQIDNELKTNIQAALSKLQKKS